MLGLSLSGESRRKSLSSPLDVEGLVSTEEAASGPTGLDNRSATSAGACLSQAPALLRVRFSGSSYLKEEENSGLPG